MVTARILAHRRQSRRNLRRRSSRHGLLQGAGGAIAARVPVRQARLAALCAAGAAVLAGLILNVVQAAQVTQASYDIGRLRAQQADLVAEQNQLRYKVVSLRAPGRVQEQAARAGLQRPIPTQYVGYTDPGFDVFARLEAAPPEAPSLWDRALAAVGSPLAGRVLAARR